MSSTPSIVAAGDAARRAEGRGERPLSWLAIPGMVTRAVEAAVARWVSPERGRSLVRAAEEALTEGTGVGTWDSMGTSFGREEADRLRGEACPAGRSGRLGDGAPFGAPFGRTARAGRRAGRDGDEDIAGRRIGADGGDGRRRHVPHADPTGSCCHRPTRLGSPVRAVDGGGAVSSKECRVWLTRDRSKTTSVSLVLPPPRHRGWFVVAGRASSQLTGPRDIASVARTCSSAQRGVTGSPVRCVRLCEASVLAPSVVHVPPGGARHAAAVGDPGSGQPRGRTRQASEERTRCG